MSRTRTNLLLQESIVTTANWDRSRGQITRVVMHTMVGTVAGATARFNNPSQKVSAHYGIGLNGSIIQWVPENATAYHAGNYAVNQTSIGIEHEDNGQSFVERTDALYDTSGRLLRDICEYYNIPLDRNHILKHNEIVRTLCPGSLNIDRIIQIAKGQIYVPPPPIIVTPPTEYNEDYHPYNTNTQTQELPIPESTQTQTDSNPSIEVTDNTNTDQQVIPQPLVNAFIGFIKHILNLKDT